MPPARAAGVYAVSTMMRTSAIAEPFVPQQHQRDLLRSQPAYILNGESVCTDGAGYQDHSSQPAQPDGHASCISACTCLEISSSCWPAQVTGNQRGRNASQLNLAGTGIATFNDRLRDAVLGGSPFAPSRCLFLTEYTTDRPTSSVS